MAIIMSSDSDDISPQTSPVIVDYNGSAPNSPMPSNVSSLTNNSSNTNTNKEKQSISSSNNIKSNISFIATNSEVNDEKVVNKPSIPFSITSILNRGDPIDKYHKQHSNPSIGEFYFQFFIQFLYYH